MYRKKIVTCITVVVIVMAFAGILYYMSHLKKNQAEMDGTFVQAFTQDVKQYGL